MKIVEVKILDIDQYDGARFSYKHKDTAVKHGPGFISGRFADYGVILTFSNSEIHIPWTQIANVITVE